MKSKDTCPVRRARADEPLDPLPDARPLDHRVVELEGRGLAAAVDPGAGRRAPCCGCSTPVPRRTPAGSTGCSSRDRQRAHVCRHRLARRRTRQAGQVEAMDGVVGDALEHVGPRGAGEVEVEHLLRVGDTVRVRARPGRAPPRRGEGVLVVEPLDGLRRRGAAPRSARTARPWHARRAGWTPGCTRGRRRPRPPGGRSRAGRRRSRGRRASGTVRKASTARENRWPVSRYFADSTRTTRCPAAWKERHSASALVILPPLTRTVRRTAGPAARAGLRPDHRPRRGRRR